MQFTWKNPLKETSYRSGLLRKKSDATQFRSHKSNRKLSVVIKYHSGALAGQFGPMQYTVLSCAMHTDTFFMEFHLLNILLLSNNSAKLAVKARQLLTTSFSNKFSLFQLSQLSQLFNFYEQYWLQYGLPFRYFFGKETTIFP